MVRVAFPIPIWVPTCVISFFLIFSFPARWNSCCSLSSGHIDLEPLQNCRSFCCLVLDRNLDISCCSLVLPIFLEISLRCISTMNSAVPSFRSCQLLSEIALHCLFTMNTKECCHNRSEVRLIPSILY